MKNEIKPKPSDIDIADAAFQAAGIENLQEGVIISPIQWTKIFEFMSKEIKFLPKDKIPFPIDPTPEE